MYVCMCLRVATENELKNRTTVKDQVSSTRMLCRTGTVCQAFGWWKMLVLNKSMCVYSEQTADICASQVEISVSTWNRRNNIFCFNVFNGSESIKNKISMYSGQLVGSNVYQR